MLASIKQYLNTLGKTYSATEHSHRPALTMLLGEMIPDAQATNEPRRIECGAPDFVIHRKEIPFGYVETKNIGANLDDAAHRAQIKRYSDALDNLIFTDYLTFRLIREGAIVAEVCIGELRGAKLSRCRKTSMRLSICLKVFPIIKGAPSAPPMSWRIEWRIKRGCWRV